MIKKHRTKPAVLHKLEILLRRLPPAHPKRPAVEKEAVKYASGYRGEQALDYHLSFINSAYPIFHDLRLSHRSTYFQIDTLLLTPSFLLLIEVKNMAGTLIFDADRYQMVRRFYGEDEGFLDPSLQVRRHQHQLEQWGGRGRRSCRPSLQRWPSVFLPPSLLHLHLPTQMVFTPHSFPSISRNWRKISRSFHSNIQHRNNDLQSKSRAAIPNILL